MIHALVYCDQGLLHNHNADSGEQPGGVDCHVHLEEPALFGGKGRSSDTFETGGWKTSLIPSIY